MIPDGQISRVRFETLAFHLCAFPASARFKRWFAYTPTSVVCPQPRSTPYDGENTGSESGGRVDDETAKCPESLCPMSMLPPPWGGVFRLLGGRCPSFVAPTDSCANPAGLPRPSATASFQESSQVATSPCCPEDLPDVISANLSSDAWPSTTAVPQSALTCFFPCVIGLPLKGRGSASRLFREYDFSAGEVDEAADISLRSGLRVCFASQVVPTAARKLPQGSRGFLHPGISCFVASARTGHANRPNTGN
jgi:hypothetical protein